MLSLNQQRKEIEKSIQGILKRIKKKYGKNKTEKTMLKLSQTLK